MTPEQQAINEYLNSNYNMHLGTASFGRSDMENLGTAVWKAALRWCMNHPFQTLKLMFKLRKES